MRTLGIRSFFDKYILDPLSKDLTKKEQKVALIGLLVLLAIPPFGLIPLGLLAMRKWEHRHDPRTTQVAGRVLGTAERPARPKASTPKAKPPVRKAPPPPPPKLKFSKKVEMIDSLAEKLAERIATEKPKRNVHCGMPNGRTNLKNVCYFNSAVQSIEAVLHSQKEFKNLLKKDLSREEGESLQDLEARLLSKWAPLNLQDPLNDSDKMIAFKWSFLLMIQAKQFGTEDQLYRAILAHRQIVFELSQEITERTNGRQLDAASYFELFNDILKLSRLGLQEVRKNGNFDEYQINADGNFTNVLQVPVLDRERLSLEDALTRYFLPERLSDPFIPEGSNTVYTHKIVRLVDNPPPVLFMQMKVFSSRAVFKQKRETVPVFEEDGNLGAVQQFREETTQEFTGNEARKLHPKIRVGLNQRVDLSHHYHQQHGSVVYELVAVCRHSGQLGSGHYTADVKPDKRWYTANDRSNRKLERELSSNDGYIYSFRRVESSEGSQE